MSGFTGVVSSESEQEFVEAADEFSKKYGAATSTLPSDEGTNRSFFVEKIAQFVINNALRGDKTLGKFLIRL